MVEHRRQPVLDEVGLGAGQQAVQHVDRRAPARRARSAMPSSIWATKKCRQPSRGEPRPDDRRAGAVGVGLEHRGAVDRPAGGAAGIAQAAPVGGDGAKVDRQDRAGPARRRVVVGGWGHRRRPRSSDAGLIVVGRQVAELGELALEGQPHDAGRAVALLGDDHLGLAVVLLAALLPVVVALVELLVALVGAPLRLLAHQVVFVAIDEHHDVGVLLDRARIRAGRRAAAACPRAARRRG